MESRIVPLLTVVWGREGGREGGGREGGREGGRGGGMIGNKACGVNKSRTYQANLATDT